MVPPHIGILLTAACCALACGQRPDLPGPATPSEDEPGDESTAGAGSTSGGLDRPDDDGVTENDGMSRPVPPADVPAAAVPDAGIAPAAPSGGDGDDEPPTIGSAQTALACTVDGGGCLIFNIAVADADADSCVQLTLDNCQRAAQAGLRVDLPVSWRLGGASVARQPDDCLPGAPYDPTNTSTIVSATGSIEWNLKTRVPSEIVLDVTLQPASTAADTTPIRITNSDLLDPPDQCDLIVAQP